MLPGLFITGTDTGVGKTHIGTALVRLLSEPGLRVAVRKPVESGCEVQEGRQVPADALALWEAAGRWEALSTVCPYRLRAAVSPERAAHLEGVELTLQMLIDACRPRPDAAQLLIVEGAGGFYSPIATQALNADLAQALDLPVLLIAADRLGVLNHALLTIEAIQRRGLRVMAVVLNQTADGAGMPVGMDNARDLRARVGCPVYSVGHGGGGGQLSEDFHATVSRLADSVMGSCQDARATGSESPLVCQRRLP